MSNETALNIVIVLNTYLSKVLRLMVALKKTITQKTVYKMTSFQKKAGLRMVSICYKCVLRSLDSLNSLH